MYDTCDFHKNKNWIVQRPGSISCEVGTAYMKFVPQYLLPQLASTIKKNKSKSCKNSSKNYQNLSKICQKRSKTLSKRCQKFVKKCQKKVSKISQKFVKKFVKKVSHKFVNNLPFAQIVRRRRRRLVAPRPGGDFVAPGKNDSKWLKTSFSVVQFLKLRLKKSLHSVREHYPMLQLGLAEFRVPK
jgi:hypothetical protein